MNIINIIEKKKFGQELSEMEIKYAVDGYTSNDIPDYQMSALLMAIRLNGMSDEETYFLTKTMLESGKQIDLRTPGQFIIDKHSSGGVGDKVSLILSPIVAALGINIAKLSGRGLGYTGGTIDKLESVGVDFEHEYNMLEQIKQHKILLMGQTKDIAPADKKIYALRDVTATVDSLPLMAGSIMSKKLALGTNCIFLDVKVGSGAFCSDYQTGEKFAKIMINIAKHFDRKVMIHLTNMNQPLGQAVGNRIEIKETISFLKGEAIHADLKNIIYEFVADILMYLKMAQDKKIAYQKIDEVIANGKAFDIFLDWVCSEGANKKQLVADTYWNPKHQSTILATADGYVSYSSTKEIGLISVDLGAGRKQKSDKIDFNAGIYLNHKTNDKVKKGDVISTLYSDKPIAEATLKRFQANIQISNKPIKLNSAILGIVK